MLGDTLAPVYLLEELKSEARKMMEELGIRHVVLSPSGVPA